MKTILMRTPNALDGVSYYRHWGPMLELEKQGHVKLVAMNNDAEITHWHYYKKVDLAFCHRPAKIYDHAFITECHKYNVPIWVDLDDNVFSVPSDNDAFDYYDKAAQSVLLYGLKSAKKVTVATPRLGEFLRSNFQINATLIPNALDDSLLCYKRGFEKNGRVCWRGSKAGQKALLHYADSISSLVVKSGLQFEFLGLSPYFISGNHTSKKSMNFIDYIIHLYKRNAPFSFMTHLDTEFDSTKSTNGWLESTLTGSVCLVPDIGDWSNLGDNMVFKYKCMNLESFSYNFKKMTEASENKLKEMHNNSMNYIENNLLLSHINKERLKIIEGING